MDTHVINVQKANLKKLGYTDFEDWIKNPNNVYIGRNVVYVKGTFNSKWRNTFPVKRMGRDDCIKAYKEYILQNPELIKDLYELKGKQLGCWCKPEKCHGDVLIELLNCLEKNSENKNRC